MTIRELIEKHKKLACSANPVERFAAALLIPSVLTRRLRQLRDSQIGQLLDGEVGAHLNLLAPEATICDEAVRRLRRQASASLERSRSGIQRRARRSWTAMRDEGVHIMHAEAALYRGGIPFLQLPWQMNRFASDTFMVPYVPEAKACLCHAGFRETPRSLALLIDRQTGRSIRLYEDRT